MNRQDYNGNGKPDPEPKAEPKQVVNEPKILVKAPEPIKPKLKKKSR